MAIQEGDEFIAERTGDQHKTSGTELREFNAYGKFKISGTDAYPDTFLGKVSVNTNNMLMNFTVTNLGGGEDWSVQLDVKQKPFLLTNSGRFYCYSNERWVTDSDDLYGGNHYNFNENSGTGNEPNYEWEHLGQLIPKGYKLHKLLMAGRTNHNSVDDMEYRIVVRYPNPISRWETGMDADGEQTVVVIASGFHLENAAVGVDLRDMTRNTIDLGNYEMLEDGFVSIYMRPTPGVSNTRYFYASWTWEVLGKDNL